jgi:hypothetical protein
MADWADLLDAFRTIREREVDICRVKKSPATGGLF